MTTWVYLDVDGVLNAVNWGIPNWGWGNTQSPAGLEQQHVRVARPLIERLNRLAARDDVEVFWLTTWCDRASQHLAPAIGLHGEHWPVVGRTHHLDPTLGRHDWWKHHAIREHLPAGQRAVWVDDELGGDGTAQEWLVENPHVIGVAPMPYVGLRPHEMTFIEDVCDLTIHHEERAL